MVFICHFVTECHYRQLRDRHCLVIQLHLWTPYGSKNDTSQCSYIMPKVLKAVVIRPHPIASADSSIMGHAWLAPVQGSVNCQNVNACLMDSSALICADYQIVIIKLLQY